MKPFQIGTVGEWATEQRLKAAHEAQARVDLRAVPKSLQKHAPIAAVWGLRDDALRQYHMSKHSMPEIFEIHDTVEKDLPAFERYWKKIEAKVVAGKCLTSTEECYWALASVHFEVAAHIVGHGRPKK